MEPWSHHDCVVYPGVVAFDPLISIESAKEIFRVEPSPDRHHGSGHVAQMRKEVSRLPALIIVGRVDDRFTESNSPLQVFAICVTDWSHIEEEAIAVRCPMCKPRRAL